MTVSKRLRFEILRRDHNRCRYCGAGAPDVTLTIDHVIPVALGGSDDPSNLVAACRDCNSGKTSSSPDSPLVADVAEDAIRWGKAMEVVAQRRAADREQRRANHGAFLDDSWNRWTYGLKTKHHFDLPANWRTSIDQFLAAGLSLEDLDELVDIAMGSRSQDPWRYFCGCCWRRIDAAHAEAAELISQQDRESSGGLSTVWTNETIGRLWIVATEQLASVRGCSVDETIAAESHCIHDREMMCGDPVCEAIAAAQMAGQTYQLQIAEGVMSDAP